jgi:hypothetical protein
VVIRGLVVAGLNVGKKNKSGSETEHLRGLVREQKSIIRQLKKQLSRAGKRPQEIEEQEEPDFDQEMAYPTQEKTFSCPNCSEKLTVLEIANRFIEMCPDKECGYRKTRKKE